MQSGGLATMGFNGPYETVATYFAAERERWVLWAPVLMGCGIGAYFSATSEPAIWTGPTVLVIASTVVLIARYRPNVALFGAALAFLALGFSSAQIRSHNVSASVLERPYGPGMISGRVVHIDAFPNSTRAVLDQVSLKKLSKEKSPDRVRIRLRAIDRPEVGSRISVFGKLLPPGRPAAPGAFDFQRYAWFLKIGAVGFAYGGVQRVESAVSDDGESLALLVSRVRQRISARIRMAAPEPSGAIAAALITGDRSGIPLDIMTAMRDSGLAHLLAISGLHMGLVAAILFFGLRLVLASREPLALRYPIKKWAAASALLGGLAYLILSGATIPTQRAFLMTGLVLVAVIFDRTAISLRLVALAATAILLIAPESLLSASFQMSFAAVVALVAVYESGRRPLGNWVSGSPFRKVVLYIAGVAVTTIVAGFATGIFGMYHFGRITHYGLLANLMAVPVTAFWIMPWAVLAMVLMPIGLEAFALAPMTWGIDAVVGIAQYVAGLPLAVSLTAAMPTAGLAAAALGGLWLCLWRQRWRYVGVAGIVAGVASVYLTDKPDVLVSSDGRLMAIRSLDGELTLSSKRREKRTASTWLRRDGQQGSQSWSAKIPLLQCDSIACIYEAKGRLVALVNDPRALGEDCQRANVIVSAVPVRGRCPSAQLVIDRFDLWRQGSHAVWLGENDLRIATVASIQGDRPWSAKRIRKRRNRLNNGARDR